jgi:hypothetical protein
VDGPVLRSSMIQYLLVLGGQVSNITITLHDYGLAFLFAWWNIPIQGREMPAERFITILF